MEGQLVCPSCGSTRVVRVKTYWVCMDCGYWWEDDEDAGG